MTVKRIGKWDIVQKEFNGMRYYLVTDGNKTYKAYTLDFAMATAYAL